MQNLSHKKEKIDYLLKEKKDFRDPSNEKNLKTTWLETILGPMLVIADDTHLHLLEFLTRDRLEKEILKFTKSGFDFQMGNSNAIESIRIELNDYFLGKIKKFKTSYHIQGTPFQKSVWSALSDIPYGETKSYREQAISLEKKTAYRAVANANGANMLALIIPCHRVIASDGTLGGYGGGLSIKQWLITHEKQYK